MIERVHASGEDISVIVNNDLDPLLKRYAKTDLMIACLSFIIILQQPDIPNTALRDGVQGASKWIADFLVTVDPSAEIPKEKMN